MFIYSLKIFRVTQFTNKTFYCDFIGGKIRVIALQGNKYQPTRYQFLLFFVQPKINYQRV